MSGTIGIALEVPATRAGISKALRLLVSLNRDYLRRHPDTPALYHSGVRYRRETGREDWKTIPEIIRDGHGDCEDLAAWLVAERLDQGRFAKPHLQKRGRLWHVVVRTAEGIEDPSRRLGM